MKVDRRRSLHTLMVEWNDCLRTIRASIASDYLRYGVKPGEQVATAGNFLIDSQMQLAGKPSLIDPTRAIIAQRERKTPLEFTDERYGINELSFCSAESAQDFSKVEVTQISRWEVLDFALGSNFNRVEHCIFSPPRATVSRHRLHEFPIELGNQIHGSADTPTKAAGSDQLP